MTKYESDGKYGKEYHLQNYHRIRQSYVDYLGGKCVWRTGKNTVCGATENLQFDHIDPALKEVNINNVMTRKREIALKEIDKCQLLCKQHHIEKTNNEKAPFTHGTMYAWWNKGCRCEICKPEWRIYQDERNAKRRLKPDDESARGPRGPYEKNPEHGTVKRYKRGCKCSDCRAANVKSVQAYRAKKQNKD